MTDCVFVKNIARQAAFLRKFNHALITPQILLGEYNPLFNRKPVPGSGRVGRTGHFYASCFQNIVNKARAIRLSRFVIGKSL